MKNLCFVAMAVVGFTMVSCEKETVDEQTISIIEKELIPQATGKGGSGSPGDRNGDAE